MCQNISVFRCLTWVKESNSILWITTTYSVSKESRSEKSSLERLTSLLLDRYLESNWKNIETVYILEMILLDSCYESVNMWG